MDFLALATERYSVRKFKNVPVEQEKIDLILKAGHLAPTACNIQPQKILVIQSEKALAKLKNATRCHFDAPCAFLVCADKTECWIRKYDGKTSGDIDAAIVTTHMMLQAQSLGLGTTWVMHFNPQVMREEFNIPQSYEPVALLVTGYAACDAEPLDLHTKYRPMDETVFYDTF